MLKNVIIKNYLSTIEKRIFQRVMKYFIFFQKQLKSTISLLMKIKEEIYLEVLML